MCFRFIISLFIGFRIRDEFGVCRVIQCDDRRFAKLLFSVDDQAVALQLAEYLHGAPSGGQYVGYSVRYFYFSFIVNVNFTL